MKSVVRADPVWRKRAQSSSARTRKKRRSSGLSAPLPPPHLYRGPIGGLGRPGLASKMEKRPRGDSRSTLRTSPVALVHFYTPVEGESSHRLLGPGLRHFSLLSFLLSPTR
ncbi:Hypothetical protein NTJ_04613 [Nesidiocoris tenuis]|uniref:Uncharacterized protein n=1 Tax=Nesidiocoris tenuis TaxID=355587 RepID=A0ABN7AK68_9HEMI|nr:Hypothetical protein NTJ_04613 [Nesidiocoris tenuis]